MLNKVTEKILHYLSLRLRLIYGKSFNPSSSYQPSSGKQIGRRSVRPKLTRLKRLHLREHG